MPQIDPNSENYGGYAGGPETLYPTTSPSEEQFYTTTPPGGPIHHDEVPPFQPENYLDFITAGTPNEVFHDAPSQFFSAFLAKKRQVIVPRVVNVVAGSSALVLQGEIDVFAYYLNGTVSTGIPVLRDGIDLSGQPVLPLVSEDNYVVFGKPGIRFFRGVYADLTAMSAVNSFVVYTVQEFPNN